MRSGLENNLTPDNVVDEIINAPRNVHDDLVVQLAKTVKAIEHQCDEYAASTNKYDVSRVEPWTEVAREIREFLVDAHGLLDAGKVDEALALFARAEKAMGGKEKLKEAIDDIDALKLRMALRLRLNPPGTNLLYDAYRKVFDGKPEEVDIYFGAKPKPQPTDTSPQQPKEEKSDMTPSNKQNPGAKTEKSGKGDKKKAGKAKNEPEKPNPEKVVAEEE